MRNISSFGLQYSGTSQAATFAGFQASPYDLIITEGAPGAGEFPAITDAQVASLKAQGRTVVGYVNVSVTDDARGYWNPAWTDNHHDNGNPTAQAPDWLKGSLLTNDDTARIVNYEDASWQTIVINQAKALVSRGYDGVFLDDIGRYEERYDDLAGQPGAPTKAQLAGEMIDLVAAVSVAIRSINPNAYVVANGSPAITVDAASPAESQKFFAAADTMLLDNPFPGDIQLALDNIQGHLPLLAVFSEDNAAQKAQEAADAYADHMIPYVAPDQSYNTLGPYVNPATAGNDQLAGGDGPNQLSGLGGNDTLTGNGGNDRIDGGAGTDIAAYSGNHTQYAIGFNSGTQTFTIADQRAGAPDGTDTVTTVEQFRFSDGVFTFDSAGHIATQTATDAAGTAPWTSIVTA